MAFISLQEGAYSFMNNAVTPTSLSFYQHTFHNRCQHKFHHAFSSTFRDHSNHNGSHKWSQISSTTHEQEESIWISSEEAARIAKEMSLTSFQAFDAYYADAVITNVHPESLSSNDHDHDKDGAAYTQDEIREIREIREITNQNTDTVTIRRINLRHLPRSLLPIQSIMNPSTASPNFFLEQANHAIESMYRWFDSFVADLGLCPWARASLHSKLGIRIKILPLYVSSSDTEGHHPYDSMTCESFTHGSSIPLQRMNHLVRESAHEFLQLTKTPTTSTTSTTPNKSKHHQDSQRALIPLIDPNTAITFVVAVPFLPPSSSSSPSPSPSFLQFQNYQEYISQLSSILPSEFDFVPFVEFFNDLDDALYDVARISKPMESDPNPALETTQREDGQLNHLMDSSSTFPTTQLGTYITLAPFHPLWQFASTIEDDMDDYDYDYDEEYDSEYDSEYTYSDKENDTIDQSHYNDVSDSKQKDHPPHEDTPSIQEEPLSIDFEKRSPYPTISIVLTKTIMDAGGETITEKIGTTNQDILDHMKVKDLQQLFLRKVILGTTSSSTTNKETTPSQ